MPGCTKAQKLRRSETVRGNAADLYRVKANNADKVESDEEAGQLPQRHSDRLGKAPYSS